MIYDFVTKSGDWFDPSVWALNTVPGLGDWADNFSGGALTISNAYMDGPSIWLNWIGQNQPSLTVSNAQVGGDSSIWTDSTNGPAAIELNNGVLYGSVIAESGPTIETIDRFSYGWNVGWTMAGTGASITVVDDGRWFNGGRLISSTDGQQDSSSKISIVFGQDLPEFQPHQPLYNFGTMESYKGGGIYINTVSPGVGSVANYGGIFADGGGLGIRADINQSSTGYIGIDNGSTFQLYGSVNGGTVYLGNASMQFMSVADLKDSTTSVFDFVGDASTLGVSGLNDVSAHYDASNNALVISGTDQGYQVTHALQMDHSHAYSDMNFSVQNGQVAYAAHPVS